MNAIRVHIFRIKKKGYKLMVIDNWGYKEEQMNKNSLKIYRHNQRWINGRLEYIEEYKSRINRLTTVLSDMPKRK